MENSSVTELFSKVGPKMRPRWYLNPPDVDATYVIDANDCFTLGHYDQCSVMLRKAIKIAIKIKLQQRGIDVTELLDKSGNELNLSGRIKLLKEHNLITQRTVSYIETVKWFGGMLELMEP